MHVQDFDPCWKAKSVGWHSLYSFNHLFSAIFVCYWSLSAFLGNTKSVANGTTFSPTASEGCDIVFIAGEERIEAHAAIYSELPSLQRAFVTWAKSRVQWHTISLYIFVQSIQRQFWLRAVGVFAHSCGRIQRLHFSAGTCHDLYEFHQVPSSSIEFIKLQPSTITTLC